MSHTIEIGYSTTNSGFSEVYKFELVNNKEEFKEKFEETFSRLYRKQHMCVLTLVDSCESWDSLPHNDDINSEFDRLWEIIIEEWAEELNS